MKVNQELTKRYYTITEVAKLFGVANSLIRYWEKEFSILKPMKNKKGDRRFTVKDIHNLERIYTLVKERGFTLDGARKELRKKKGTSIPSSGVNTEELRKRLLETRSILQRILEKL